MLLRELTASQFAEWIAYAELEPFGPAHESMLIGMLCATVANYSQMRVKDGVGKDKYWVPADFIPDPLIEPEEQHERKQSTGDMKTILEAIAKGSK